MTQPRLMSGAVAAAYCGLSPASFAKWVADGRAPKPLPGTRRWDKHALDAMIDKISGLDTTIVPEEDPFEKWKREHESAKAARSGDRN
jgi:hypothetical protein